MQEKGEAKSFESERIVGEISTRTMSYNPNYQGGGGGYGGGNYRAGGGGGGGSWQQQQQGGGGSNNYQSNNYNRNSYNGGDGGGGGPRKRVNGKQIWTTVLVARPTRHADSPSHDVLAPR